MYYLIKADRFHSYRTPIGAALVWLAEHERSAYAERIVACGSRDTIQHDRFFFHVHHPRCATAWYVLHNVFPVPVHVSAQRKLGREDPRTVVQALTRVVDDLRSSFHYSLDQAGDESGPQYARYGGYCGMTYIALYAEPCARRENPPSTRYAEPADGWSVDALRHIFMEAMR